MHRGLRNIKVRLLTSLGLYPTLVFDILLSFCVGFVMYSYPIFVRSLCRSVWSMRICLVVGYGLCSQTFNSVITLYQILRLKMLFVTANLNYYCIETTINNKLVDLSIPLYCISRLLRYSVELFVYFIFHLTLFDSSVHNERDKYALN